MAQKIVTVCDAHADVEEHAGEAQPAISLDGGRTYYATDLCDTAAKEFIEPLREFLAHHARTLTGEEVVTMRRQATKKPTASAAQASKAACPDCGKGPMVRSSLRTHMPSHHGKSLPQMEAELGTTLDGRKVVLYCDECGGGFADDRGLAVHRRAGCPDTHLAPRPAPAKKTAKRTKKAAT